MVAQANKTLNRNKQDRLDQNGKKHSLHKCKKRFTLFILVTFVALFKRFFNFLNYS